MAQGAIKTRKPTSSSSSSSNSRKPAPTKKGHRAIAPKKKHLVQQGKITKKYTAGLTGKTERALAGKAGHLELLGGGKGKGGKVKEKEKEKEKGRGKGGG